MAQPKTYFLTPDFDCPPNTAIRLGHILASPLTPYEPLNVDELITVPPEISICTSKTGFSATRSQLRSGTFGVFAQIFAGTFGGGELSHTFEKNQEITLAIDEVETTFIQPAGAATKAYLRSSIDGDDVQAFLKVSRWKKSVYMIVGLKIAKGARVSTGNSKVNQSTALVMVDGTSVGAPVSVGPKAEIRREDGDEVKWRDKKSFVFAYRLRKISCKKGKIVEDAQHNKGAFMDVQPSQLMATSDAERDYLIEEEDFDMEGDENGQVTSIEDGKGNDVYIVAKT